MWCPDDGVGGQLRDIVSGESTPFQKMGSCLTRMPSSGPTKWGHSPQEVDTEDKVEVEATQIDVVEVEGEVLAVDAKCNANWWSLGSQSSTSIRMFSGRPPTNSSAFWAGVKLGEWQSSALKPSVYSWTVEPIGSPHRSGQFGQPIGTAGWPKA